MDKKRGKGNGSKKRAAKNQPQQQQHHPWDEVSLPGAGSNSSEQQPTILQVLNNKLNVNVADTEEEISQQPLEATEELNEDIAAATTEVTGATGATVEAHSTTRTTADDGDDKKAQIQKSDKLVSSDSTADVNSNKEDSVKIPASGEEVKAAGTNSEHVLDIESHLIETYDDYQANEKDSVGIDELPPIKHELTQGTSKIETDANVRSVIEVEPAGVKTKQPIETLVQSSQAQLLEETDDNSQPRESVQQTQQQLSESIKEAAEKLLNEIEKEALELLSQRIAEAEIESEINIPVEAVEVDIEKEENPATEIVENEIKCEIEGEAAATEGVETEVNSDRATEEKTEPTTTNLLTEYHDANFLTLITPTLSQKVDEQLSEVTSILKASKPVSGTANTDHVSVSLSGVDGEKLNVNIDKPNKELKIIDVPSPKTPSEAEERKLFIESLPHIENDTDAQKLAADCKREYYQSLRKYLVEGSTDKPPIPLQTYRWEDLRRAKERGGYPWTHLYKRPLGPYDEPEIVLLLRKSQELRFASESPKSLKKVRIDEQVLVKETERYIQELSEEEEEDHHQSAPENEETHSLHSESVSCVSDSVLATIKPRKSGRLEKIRGILRRRKSGRTHEDAQSLPGTSRSTSCHHSEENLAPEDPPKIVVSPEHKTPRCYPIMKKLKSMADRQKKRLHIKRINLGKDDKIVLDEETKIMKLKKSPKSDRSEIPHFIEKQDSDDVLEIVELDESPSRRRKDDGRDIDDEVVDASAQHGSAGATASVVVPDEIIEIAAATNAITEKLENEPTLEGTVEHVETKEIAATTSAPPMRTPRLRREHVYEEIGNSDAIVTTPSDIFATVSVESIKKSLVKQDNCALSEMEAIAKPMPLDRMGSSEEEQVATAAADGKMTLNLLAPISSIDSTSSDEDRNKVQLSPVAEESDAGSADFAADRDVSVKVLKVIDENEHDVELKPAIKKEASPAPSDKKVTFSHVEDEAEPHREDVELPEEIMRETAAKKKFKNLSDHEYEPIGEPQAEEKPYIAKESSPAEGQHHLQLGDNKSKLSMEIESLRDEMQMAEDLQKDLEERYFSSETTTPRTESRTETYEIHTSQVDSSALEELPLKPENRKKGFMASAQDRTRRMQAGFKNQAGKIKTKIRSPAKKIPPSGSPKAKERKRFKAPEFSKIKMPEIKRPDMSKLKEFKRPEFTKFNKPDMSKFKLPEKFSSLKLRRSKSLKENEIPDDEMSGITPESGLPVAAEPTQPPKRMFEVNFGTFPRAFRKKKPQKLESQPSFGNDTGTEGLSVLTSTETQPSMESSSSPQGDRGPGPVRSRWADKFSDVSYNDSEGSRYRRYGSEQESFDRESSLERRMKEDLEETGSEDPNLGILSGGVGENTQFAEFDEENRAIHEISNLRAGEFKRRPMIHQDSDLRSEDSKEAEGWTDKEIQKNKLLRKAELEAEASYLKYPSDEGITQETQSTASSGKKVVMEEIDDDEFFLRKRGISEDNIELRKYISEAIREGYDDMPINSLQHVGQTNEATEYGDYDIPPPKPRRLHKSYRPEDVSQEFGGSQRSDYGDDLSMSQNGSDFFGAPKRPLRKGRGRSKYSMDSQDVPMVDEHISHQQYFDDDEDYLRPPPRSAYKKGDLEMNDLNVREKEVYPAEEIEVDAAPHPQPQAPSRRRKRQLRESTSMDKDSYINGFGGRSVSNSYLQPPEDVIVYRTEHEYPIPLATPEIYTDESRKSRSASRYDEDDRTSRGADSLALDGNLRSQYNEDAAAADDVHEKFIIDMMENDGYAIVRKEHMPKPTPPARRKKFTRSPGERFATLPTTRHAKHKTTPPPERPPPPHDYIPTTDSPLPIPPRRKSSISLEASQNYEEDDYEEPELMERPESPRNLQSGEIINKMKYRPLPAPPRPPREKRQRAESKGSTQDGVESSFDERDDTGERIATSSTADSYDHTEDFGSESRIPEVEVSTQTDPLPDDFVCEEFEITEDMKVIEPRRKAKTIDEMIKEELEAADLEAIKRKMTEDEQLQYGLQRFRDANQRSMSERSRTSSQLDRSKSGSKSASRPPTPSAIVIERRVSTPLPSQQSETMLEAALIVRPIDDLDLEEEALRREGLLTDSSQQSKSDIESHETEDEEMQIKLLSSDYSRGPSSEELDAAKEGLRSQVGQSEMESEKGTLEEEVGRRMRDYGYADDEEGEEVDDDAERYSNHYDEDEEEENEKDKTQLDSDMSQTIKDMLPTVFADDKEEHKLFEEYEFDIKEHVSEDPAKYDYERKKSEDRELLPTQDFEKSDDEIFTEEPPQPPPRRKSTTAIEQTTPTLAIVEQPVTTKEITPVKSLEQQSQAQFPTRLEDLEVERLRVHALQAGQIMVSQLHGTQISSDELECKSGSLVVKSIELPPGFIEDIVERVRSTDRSQLLTAETQTSLQASSETLPTEQILPVQEMVPPPKPPRHKDFELLPPPTQLPATSDDSFLERLRNFDEQTQTDPTETITTATSPQPPPVYATTEYLQSLGPLAFYNMRRADEARDDDETSSHRRRRHHHHHHYRKRDSSCSETDEAYADETESQGQRHRSRSSTRPPPEQPQTVMKAGRQFISACSLSLVNIINQLTGCIRGADPANEDDNARVRQVPTLVVLFIVITFGLLLFLLSGKSVHTHHWDYFNPPGNEGRQS